MGTALTEERGLYAALNNCAFVSTKDLDTNPRGVADPFVFLMEASMLGVGVGFDTKGAASVNIRRVEKSQKGTNLIYCDQSANPPLSAMVVDDSREGWIDSVRALLEAYITPTDASQPGSLPEFDYSLVRPSGSPIKGFGGISRGPEPLQELHESLAAIFEQRRGDSQSVPLDGECIVDIMNMIGRCVVAGNVRRTAEIAFAKLPVRGEDSDDCDWFLELKDYDRNPNRAAFGWASNNSVMATVGKNDLKYPKLAQRISSNGEPGIAWPQNMAK